MQEKARESEPGNKEKRKKMSLLSLYLTVLKVVQNLPDGEPAITLLHTNLYFKIGKEMTLISDQRETAFCSSIACVLEQFLLLCWFSTLQAKLPVCSSSRC